MKYWVHIDGETSEQVFSVEELQKLDGFGPETLVCPTGEDLWRKAQEFDSLLKVLKPSVSPPSTNSKRRTQNDQPKNPRSSSQSVSGEFSIDLEELAIGFFEELGIVPKNDNSFESEKSSLPIEGDDYRCVEHHDDEWGDAVLVLLDRDKSSVKKIQRRLFHDSGDVFKARKEGYKYGFFVNDTGPSTLMDLKEVL